MSGFFLVAATFLAAGVDMMEALTIVLAAGVTRGWRSSLVGVGAALAVLQKGRERVDGLSARTVDKWLGGTAPRPGCPHGASGRVG